MVQELPGQDVRQIPPKLQNILEFLMQKQSSLDHQAKKIVSGYPYIIIPVMLQ